jgi:hypothetical protein
MKSALLLEDNQRRRQTACSIWYGIDDRQLSPRVRCVPDGLLRGFHQQIVRSHEDRALEESVVAVQMPTGDTISIGERKKWKGGGETDLQEERTEVRISSSKFAVELPDSAALTEWLYPREYAACSANQHHA